MLLKNLIIGLIGLVFVWFTSKELQMNVDNWSGVKTAHAFLQPDEASAISYISIIPGFLKKDSLVEGGAQLIKNNDRWVLPLESNYPADEDFVAKIIEQLSDQHAEVIEPSKNMRDKLEKDKAVFTLSFGPNKKHLKTIGIYSYKTTDNKLYLRDHAKNVYIVGDIFWQSLMSQGSTVFFQKEIFLLDEGLKTIILRKSDRKEYIYHYTKATKTWAFAGDAKKEYSDKVMAHFINDIMQVKAKNMITPLQRLKKGLNVDESSYKITPSAFELEFIYSNPQQKNWLVKFGSDINGITFSKIYPYEIILELETKNLIAIKSYLNDFN